LHEDLRFQRRNKTERPMVDPGGQRPHLFRQPSPRTCSAVTRAISFRLVEDAGFEIWPETLRNVRSPDS
jgi:hypothetical protein